MLSLLELSKRSSLMFEFVCILRLILRRRDLRPLFFHCHSQIVRFHIDYQGNCLISVCFDLHFNYHSLIYIVPWCHFQWTSFHFMMIPLAFDMFSIQFNWFFPRFFCSLSSNVSITQCVIFSSFSFSSHFQIVQCSIKIELVNDSWTELRGEIAGPPDTPYEGGKFQLEIKVPETYPFNPPKVIASQDKMARRQIMMNKRIVTEHDLNMLLLFLLSLCLLIPQVRFITRIWHPNISSVTGAICLDILKDNW